MARIRKVTKVNRGISMCNEESADKKIERSIIDVNHLNRKLCSNDRNRRILLNLRSYTNLFLTNNFSSNLLPAVRKYSISVSTQTSSTGSFNDGRKTMSTQTYIWVQEEQGLKKTNDKFVRQSKSHCSLLQDYKLNTKNSLSEQVQTSDLEIFDNLKQNEDKNMPKNVILLHKNENINSPKITALKNKTKIKNQTGKKFNSRVYIKKKTNRHFHSYKINRKSRKTKELKANDSYTNFYHQLIKKIGKYSLTTAAKCSSHLMRIFSDLGVSLAESLTNLYKFYETQKCQSLNPLCQEFNPKIDQLVSKLNQLEESIQMSHAKIFEQQKWIYKTDELARKLEETKQKLESYDLLKLELADLRKQLNGSTGDPPIITNPPTPPPPPPLPIFSLTTNCASKTFLNAVQNERKLINCESSRPIITLEDILNVKLKKISVSNI